MPCVVGNPTVSLLPTMCAHVTWAILRHFIGHIQFDLFVVLFLASPVTIGVVISPLPSPLFVRADDLSLHLYFGTPSPMEHYRFTAVESCTAIRLLGTS